MAASRRPKTDTDHLAWWLDKLGRMNDRTFMTPKRSPHIIDELLAAKNGVIRASSIKELGVKLGVPLKFVLRAVASVARLGIVTAELEPPGIRLTIHRDRFGHRKIAIDRKRRPLSAADRESIQGQGRAPLFVLRRHVRVRGIGTRPPDPIQSEGCRRIGESRGDVQAPQLTKVGPSGSR